MDHNVTATAQPTSFIGVTFVDGQEQTIPGSEGQSVDVACDSCGWTHCGVITSTIQEVEQRMTALHRSYLPASA